MSRTKGAKDKKPRKSKGIDISQTNIKVSFVHSDVSKIVYKGNSKRITF